MEAVAAIAPAPLNDECEHCHGVGSFGGEECWFCDGKGVELSVACNAESEGSDVLGKLRVSPVPLELFEAAEQRKRNGCSLPRDEVILSHAISRGVEGSSES